MSTGILRFLVLLLGLKSRRGLSDVRSCDYIAISTQSLYAPLRLLS